jgi:hypothetical protein
VKNAYDDAYSVLIESSSTEGGDYTTVADVNVAEVEGTTEYITEVEFDVDGAGDYLAVTITGVTGGVISALLIASPKYSNHTQPTVTGSYGDD